VNTANIHIASTPEALKEKLNGLQDIAQLHVLNTTIWEMRHSGSGQFYELSLEALEIARNQIENISVKDLAQAYLNLGNTAWNRSLPDTAFDALQRSQRLFRSVGDLGKAAFAEAVMANLHSQKGEFEQAFSIIFKVIDELVPSENPEVAGLAFLSAGSFHFDLESYEESLNFFIKSYEVFSSIQDEIGIARSTNNAGGALYKLGRHEEGLEYCQKSLEIYEKLDLDQGKAKANRDIGKILQSQSRYEEALDYYLKSLSLRDNASKSKSSGIDGVITCLIDIGHLLNRMNKPQEAISYLEQAMDLSLRWKTVPKQIKIHRRLAEAEKALGNFEKAYFHLEQTQEMRQEMLGQETANKIKIMQTRYALEITQKEAEIEKTKNDELNRAYQRINQINKNLTDSLQYAKRIQNALLPSNQRFKQTFADSFILNLPKDIVSGDYFWIAQKNGFHLLAVADCSGHGVPGAFMSMVGMSLLNQIVNERGVLQPGKILNQMNLALINNLNQISDSEGSVEGIDIGLCVFDPMFTQVVFAGARRPLYYLQDGKIQELKSTPSSIGFDPYTDFGEKFYRLDLSNVDAIYLTTDGYADQFGEANGKKMMVGILKSTLEKNSGLPMEEQHRLLHEQFSNWKGDEPQTDDVLVVGIRL
jgi:serine phosphatase RsbU (regulator of sigma subunit)